MPILDIVKLNSPILRQPAQPVTQFDHNLQQLVDNMIETMRQASGVGLAAPQVNLPLRLTVIETPPKLDDEGNEIEGTRQLFVLVNPEITWMSREMVEGVEGCLSIPGYVGEVSRHYRIRVRGQDRHGNKVRLQLGGWTARIFQHEIDHLNGILYIDKLTDPNYFWTEEEYQEMIAAEEAAQV
jgi:peptide deformylase